MSKINFKAIQGRLGQAAGLAAGASAGKYASKAMETMAGGKIKPIVNAGIRVAIGALLPSVTKSKSGFMMDFANGVLAGAAVDLGGILKIPGMYGIGAPDYEEPIGEYVNGTEVEHTINGTGN